MKKKLTFTILAVVLFSLSGHAQVGINTTTPKSTLHIAGDMTLNSSLNVGGDISTAGNPGNSDEILQSQGIGLPPIWKSMNDILQPTSFLNNQTTNIFLPSGLNMPWLGIPALSQVIDIPAGKKALIIISGQICVQQTKDALPLWGISVGVFESTNTSPLISSTGQLTNVNNYIQEFINMPFSYSDFIVNNGSVPVQKTYTIKARVNYGGNSDASDIRVVNDPFNRGDYSQLRVSVLIF
jgi:hypothetical protein